MTSTTSAPGTGQEAIEVRTENLFQRTEVLAGMYQHIKTTYRDMSRTTGQEVHTSILSPQVDYSEISIHHSRFYWQTSKSWEIFSLLSPI